MPITNDDYFEVTYFPFNHSASTMRETAQRTDFNKKKSLGNQVKYVDVCPPAWQPVDYATMIWCSHDMLWAHAVHNLSMTCIEWKLMNF